MAGAAKRPAVGMLPAFFGLVVAFSIPFWLLDVVAGHLPGWLPDNLPVSALQGVCPALAAAVLLWRTYGTASLGSLVKRTIDVGENRNRAWYLLVVFLFPVFMLPLSIAVMRFAGRPLPDPQFDLAALPLLVLVYFTFAAGEELGWTAFALGPMQQRWSPVGAALLLGAFGAAWHAIPYLQGGNSATWIAGQFLFTVSSRVVIVWLYNNTGGGVLAAIGAHTMSNVSWTLFPNKGSHYDPLVTGAIMAVLAVVVAVGSRSLGRAGVNRWSGSGKLG